MSSWLSGQPEWIWSDPMGAALFVLDHPSLRTIARAHVFVDGRRIDWREMRSQCPAPADQDLVDIARVLCDSRGDITLLKMLSLTNERLERVILAVRLLKGMIKPSEALRAIERSRRR